MAACTLLFEGQSEVSSTSNATINSILKTCVYASIQEVNIKEKRIYNIASKFGYVKFFCHV
jgi:hypothetical protein